MIVLPGLLLVFALGFPAQTVHATNSIADSGWHFDDEWTFDNPYEFTNTYSFDNEWTFNDNWKPERTWSSSASYQSPDPYVSSASYSYDSEYEPEELWAYDDEYEYESSYSYEGDYEFDAEYEFTDRYDFASNYESSSDYEFNDEYDFESDYESSSDYSFNESYEYTSDYEFTGGYEPGPAYEFTSDYESPSDYEFDDEYDFESDYESPPDYEFTGGYEFESDYESSSDYEFDDEYTFDGGYEFTGGYKPPPPYEFDNPYEPGGGGGGGNGGGDGGDDDTPPDVPPASCQIPNPEIATNFPPLNAGPVIALGDSLTAGVGATAGQDYVSELERLSGTDIINAGISGDTTEDVLARLEADVLSQNPSVVILLVGGNDILQRAYAEAIDADGDDTFIDAIIAALLRLFGKVPDEPDRITEDETFANIESMVEQIQATGALVIVVGIEGKPFERDLSVRYEAVAANTTTFFVPDVLDGLIGRPAFMSDLVHPNNAGYDIVAQRIFAAYACVTELDAG